MPARKKESRFVRVRRIPKGAVRSHLRTTQEFTPIQRGGDCLSGPCLEGTLQSIPELDSRRSTLVAMQFLLLAFAALLFSFGGLAMKASAGLTRMGPSLAVFVLFCGGAACQALGMRRTEMGVAYISVLGLEAITAFALSWLALGERVTISKIGALLLIMGGIALLDRH
jgi:quaternary ammonium compound-resistance protein SugE